MTLDTYYRDQVVERLEREPDATFQASGITKQQILADNDAIELIWSHYQKAIEDYDMDADYAFGDAIYEIYHRKVEGWL